MRMIAEEVVGYLAIDYIAKYLSIKVKTVYALVESGKIPHYRVGRLIRFRKDEIDAWMIGNGAGQRGDNNIPAANPRRGRRSNHNCVQDIDKIIRKAIDQEQGEGYTSSCGKSDRTKGLGKEVDYGSL